MPNPPKRLTPKRLPPGRLARIRREVEEAGRNSLCIPMEQTNLFRDLSYLLREIDALEAELRRRLPENPS